MGSRRRLRELRAEHDAYVAAMRSTYLTVSAIPGRRLLGPVSLEFLARRTGPGGWADHMKGVIQVKFERRDG